jgi:hypothetical protein
MDAIHWAQRRDAGPCRLLEGAHLFPLASRCGQPDSLPGAMKANRIGR